MPNKTDNIDAVLQCCS